MPKEMDEFCRLCLKLIDTLVADTSNYVIIENENENIHSKLIIEQLCACIPEIDINLIGMSIICSCCKNLLDEFYYFKNSCLRSDKFLRDYLKKINSIHESIKHKDVHFQDHNYVSGTPNKTSKVVSRDISLASCDDETRENECDPIVINLSSCPVTNTPEELLDDNMIVLEDNLITTFPSNNEVTTEKSTSPQRNAVTVNETSASSHPSPNRTLKRRVAKICKDIVAKTDVKIDKLEIITNAKMNLDTQQRDDEKNVQSNHLHPSRHKRKRRSQDGSNVRKKICAETRKVQEEGFKVNINNSFESVGSELNQTLQNTSMEDPRKNEETVSIRCLKFKIKKKLSTDKNTRNLLGNKERDKLLFPSDKTTLDSLKYMTDIVVDDHSCCKKCNPLLDCKVVLEKNKILSRKQCIQTRQFYICVLCNDIFETSLELKCHWSNVACKIKRLTFTADQDLATEKNLDTEIYLSDVCETIFLNRDDLEQHILIDAHENAYFCFNSSCPRCGYRLTRNPESESLLCKVCGASWSTNQFQEL